MFVTVSAVAMTGLVSLAMGLRYLFATRTDVVKDRLKRSVSLSPAVESTTATRAGTALWKQVLSPIAEIAKPGNTEELGRLRGKLSHAGFRGEGATTVYLGVKVTLGLVFALGFLWVNSLRPQPLTNAALFTISAMAIGFYAPSLWLMGRIRERQSEINHALPNAMDLLVTCVEAGLGLDAAMNRVADELSLGSPLLSNELAQTALEIRAGVQRGDAFRRMAERTGVEELRNLSAIIVQTQVFGTSIAKSLRVQADAMRIRRMQIAEERAASVAVKMTVPLIFCILPSLFAILLGPAVVKIIRILMPTLGGG